MTAAARELETTQPAISQRIRSLEDSVGLVLLDRSGGRLSATQCGRELFDEVAVSLGRIHSTVRRLQASKDLSQHHRVSIAVPSGFAHLWLLPRLDRLEAALPQIQFEIIPVDRDDDKETVHADLSVHFGRFDCVDGSEDMLEAEEVFPVCSAEFAAHHRLLDLRDVDLDTIQILHMDVGDVRWLDWEKWCRLIGARTPMQPPRIRYHNYPLMLEAAAQGQGLALGWSTLVRQLIEEGKLVALTPSIRRSNFGYILRTRYADNAIVGPIRLWFLKHVNSCIPSEK